MERYKVCEAIGIEPTKRNLIVVSSALTALKAKGLVNVANNKWRRLPGANLEGANPMTNRTAMPHAILARLEKISLLQMELIEDIKPLLITPAERWEFDDLRKFKAELNEQIRSMTTPRRR